MNHKIRVGSVSLFCSALSKIKIPSNVCLAFEIILIGAIGSSASHVHMGWRFPILFNDRYCFVCFQFCSESVTLETKLRCHAISLLCFSPENTVGEGKIV